MADDTQRPDSVSQTDRKKTSGLLDLVERAGNKLPDPSILFFLGAVLVMLVSALASWLNWSVVKKVPKTSVDPETGETSFELVPSMVEVSSVNEAGETVVTMAEELLEPVSLLTADGLFWAVSTLVQNFMSFPPLGIVLVGMLGIGVAERVGLAAAALKLLMSITPASLLTPAVVFIGVFSSLGIDAGYVVLPPLAALLFKAVGRSPIVGIAAVFSGVAAGFGSNILLTAMDPLLAEFTTIGAGFLDPDYVVSPNANWLFMIASTFMATFVGWGVTAWVVEPRFEKKPEAEGGPSATSESSAEQSLTSQEVVGLVLAALALFGVLAVTAACIFIEGFPLYGTQGNFARWVVAIVPILFVSFLVPGIAFGVHNGRIRSSQDLAKLMIEAIAAMAPIIVLAFFAAQFVAYFAKSNLGAMLAIAGGEMLAQAALPTFVLILCFIGLSAFFNLFMGSMSAKYALLAPIFVPMLMVVGISPELTQVAYRIGDSVTNIITPLNAYLVIILMFMKKYDRSAGMGTLIATMLPYTIFLTIGWCLLLGVWMFFELPLGLFPFESGPLSYPPPASP